MGKELFQVLSDFISNFAFLEMAPFFNSSLMTDSSTRKLSATCFACSTRSKRFEISETKGKISVYSGDFSFNRTDVMLASSLTDEIVHIVGSPV